MKNKYTQTFVNRRKIVTVAGFTLIETLVAISILLVSIAGPLTIAAKGLQAAVYARDQITAFYLAQDAVEYIRNKRDGNTLSSNYWLTGFGIDGGFPDCTSLNKCIVDVKNNTIDECSGGSCSPLRYNESTAFYSYNVSYPVSSFTREVQIVPINADEVTIEVSIYWQTGVLQRSFTVKENIFNWQAP